MAIPKLASYPMPQAAQFPAGKVNWQLDAQRAVLLIHDMQDYFVGFYGEASPLVAELIEQIAQLRAWCKAQGIPVVYTAQPTEQNPLDRALLNDMWGPGLTAADPALQRIVPAIAPDANDTVLVKWRYSAFHRSDLQERMRAWGRDQLVICGVYAHIGCMTTAIDAFMRDIQPFMVGDALADFSEAEHRMALQYVATRCGRVVSTREVIAPRADRAWLEASVLALIDESERAGFDADENLMDYGIDSVRVMTLVAEWQKRGITVSFEDLARRPTLNSWWALIERASA